MVGKKIKSLVLTGVLLVSLPVAALAKGPEKKVIDYVALGDSLAVGVTPNNEMGLGYPDYLTKRFEQSQYTVGYDNFAVPGYISGQLVGDVLYNEKVRSGIKEAEFITIDIGGNDILAALKVDPTGKTTVPAAIAGVTKNLNTILSTINDLNPKAKVYVMGYYNTFPYLPVDQQAVLLPLLDILNNQIKMASTTNGDTFVPTYNIIAKDYKTYLPNPANIHLSLEGYQIVAKEFWKVIDKSKSNSK
ncbi:GDSL-type esterase/lipase family protein [Neobacillus mesonae]|uniref:GDSL-type esterase/lipase family protein n=1 Tax=Neobacillus mesonae TaxID=1193713 RepID=UPI002E2001E5|nr:GDSL-type esterase/lipase family protein [Neobacillus mesonae]